MLIGFQARHFAVLDDFSIGFNPKSWDLGLERGRASDTILADSVSRPLRSLTSFIGRNSTGKSAVFEALDFLSDCSRYDLPYAATLKSRSGFSELRTYGCEDNTTLTVHCLLPEAGEIFSWSLTIGADCHNRPHIVKEEVLGRFCSADLLRRLDLESLLPKIRWRTEEYDDVRVYLRLNNGSGTIWTEAGEESAGVADRRWSGLSVYGSLLSHPALDLLLRYVRHWYFCRIGTKSAMNPVGTQYKEGDTTQLASGGGHKHLNIYGSNVRNVLRYLKRQKPNKYQEIMRQITQHIPGRRKINLREIEKNLHVGEAKLFLFLLMLADPQPRPLIMMDNPDTGLHHEMVAALSLAMREATVRHYGEVQLMFSSHNTLMLDMLAPEEVWIFRKSMNEDGEKIGSHANCVAESSVVRAMYDEGISLGSLWYSGHFDSIDDGEDAEYSLAGEPDESRINVVDDLNDDSSNSYIKFD